MRVALGICVIAAAAGVLCAADPVGVWNAPGASHLGGPSADGRFLTGIEPGSGALLVRDLASGSERRLTEPSTGGEFAYFSVLSQDGKLAAYAWFNRDRFYELRVVALDGGEPRTLYRNEEAGFVQPCAFSTDFKQILTLLFRKDNVSQIALISTVDGSVQILKSLNWVYPKRMDFSPDGKSIVYDNFASDGVAQRDIFLLSADGLRETRLVESPADDQFPVFSADGTHVYFSSDRQHGTGGATPRLWSVRLSDGSTEMIRDGLGRFLVLGLSGPHRLLYATRTGGVHVYRAGIDLKEGKLTTPPEKLGEGSAAAWSPDGKRMAWLGRRISENFGTDSHYVAVFDAKSETVKTVDARLAHIERLTWSSKGDAILASGSDAKGRGGVFRVALDGAGHGAAPLVRDSNAPHTGYAAAGDYVAKGREILKGGEAALTAARDVESLAVSRDGALLAYSDGRAIVVTGARPIPVSKPVRAMEFTPDTRRLILVQDDEIWLQPLDGEAATRVARAATAIDSISLSPDGGTILFAAGKPVSGVWSVDLEGSGRER